MVVILITCVLGQLHSEHSIPTSMVLAASIRSYAVFFTLGIVLCFPTCHTSSQPLWLWVQKWIIQQNPVICLNDENNHSLAIFLPLVLS